jgi:hypothetical protein
MPHTFPEHQVVQYLLVTHCLLVGSSVYLFILSYGMDPVG